MLSNEFVITVHHVENLVEVAVLVSCVVDVLHGLKVLLVLNEDNFLLRNITPFEVTNDLLDTVIIRGIVDDDKAIVRVILRQNRFEVPDRTIFLGVSVGRRYDAGRQFFVLLSFVLFIEGRLFSVTNNIEINIVAQIFSIKHTILHRFNQLLECNAFVKVRDLPI